MSTKLGVGDKAPDFELPGSDGHAVRLSAFHGERVVVLYFYPKDETPGCTAQACAFRDSYEVFTDAGAEVVGVSADDAESHVKFIDHHNLPFTLVSDADGALRKAYGVKTVFGVLPGRVTFVIGLDGNVAHVFSSMTNISGHVNDALKVVQDLAAAT